MSQSGVASIQNGDLPPDVPLVFAGNVGTGSAIANLFEILGTGSISTSVSLNVLDISLSGITQYNVLVGGSGNTISNVPPVSSGYVLTDNGPGFAPSFKAATSGVQSVSGTLNRITSTGGTTPVIDISAAYVGQTSITTLGTIGTGTWAGTTVAANHGGTGVANAAGSTITLGGALTTSGAFASTFTMTNTTTVTFPTSGTLATTSQLPSITATQYDVLVGGAANAVVSVGPGSAGQVLQSGGNASNPAYSTSTYPATNAANTLLYASSANVMAALATANNGVLLTSGAGVPSIGTATVAVGGTGIQTTTAYGVICGGTTATGNFQNAGAGSSTQVLTSNGASALPSFQALPGITLYFNSTSLTNAQIKALNTTAVSILPAQGAGIVSVPVSIAIKLYYGGTNAFSGGTATHFCYGTTAETNIIFGATTTSFWNKTANEYLIPASNTTGSAFIFAGTAAENAAISISTSTAITGNAAADNTAVVSIVYYTIGL